jgi:hypothetical protein
MLVVLALVFAIAVLKGCGSPDSDPCSWTGTINKQQHEITWTGASSRCCMAQIALKLDDETSAFEDCENQSYVETTKVNGGSCDGEGCQLMKVSIGINTFTSLVYGAPGPSGDTLCESMKKGFNPETFCGKDVIESDPCSWAGVHNDEAIEITWTGASRGCCKHQLALLLGEKSSDTSACETDRSVVEIKKVGYGSSCDGEACQIMRVSGDTKTVAMTIYSAGADASCETLKKGTKNPPYNHCLRTVVEKSENATGSVVFPIAHVADKWVEKAKLKFGPLSTP